jgi:2-hydroxy-6-oxonona-2,4-dienedioate hydrolase
MTQSTVPEAAEKANLGGTWTTVSGLRIHALVADKIAPAGAKTVVLVHGVGVSSRYMVPLAERLAPRYRVFAPDLPGFGGSDRPPRMLDVPGLADALAAWLRIRAPGRTNMVGNSLGCQVILDLAARFPELIDRAILIGPTTDPGVRNLFLLLARGVLDLPQESAALYPILVTDYLRAGLLRTMWTLQAGVDDPLISKLPQVQAPVLVVRGERDPIASRKWVRKLSQNVPTGKWSEIPGAAHAAHFSAPEWMAKLAGEFLDRAV